MRKSKTLAKIRQGEVIRTCVIGHYIPAYVCHAARAGYDCIWVDLEHRAMTKREVEALLAFSHLYDIDIMMRPPTLEKTGLYRYLEDGAAGLLIPHVSTAERAKMLVDAVKFPPLGDRGIDNAGLDADFHIHDADEYVAWANRETFLCVQIETPEGVHNVEEIAAVEGVDMIFVGPGDLGLRLRQSGEMTLDEAWEIVAAACRKHGKAFGGPTLATSEMQKRKDLGAQLLVNSSEFQGWSAALSQDGRRFEDLT
ncbi:2-keto-3-deoxy-L-rhamnonate aldolase [Rosistilla oblonga]|uniref:2-keto-3-deoxy-L-rhamnonate aldolase n=1 Tax=Rosistilla oblonga TaxID=2527990 RepID=A0A518J2A4_9BACT|nr:aldolase/citrate lyase family protein [Rosistilla oblonga]QDV12427.1 2-keto-3-deoxy-L-rhamnonate aldolase [Rosistilla oblonga]QDV59466.1 2-keto-3-deoxy-L-rhamnonate aldolase [Rosistilla oblonga]